MGDISCVKWRAWLWIGHLCQLGWTHLLFNPDNDLYTERNYSVQQIRRSIIISPGKIHILLFFHLKAVVELLLRINDMTPITTNEDSLTDIDAKRTTYETEMGLIDQWIILTSFHGAQESSACSVDIKLYRVSLD